MQHEIKVVSSRVVYTKFGMSVVEETFSRNGSTGCYRYIVMSPSVRIIPITLSGDIVFIRQFKYPFNSEILCLPAGTIEQGETGVQAAVRELREETGYMPDEVIEIGRFYPMAATIRQECTVVLATGCHKETLAPEMPDDDLENETKVQLIKIERVEQLVLNDAIIDGQAITALYKGMAYLKARDMLCLASH